MTGRFVVRTGAGAIEEHPIRPGFTIGSTAPSDLVVEGADVLPLHATVEMRDSRCWIEAAGGGAIAINGVAAARRALRHLDVITLGATVHLIFCTSTAHAAPVRTERAAVVPRLPRAGGAAKTALGVPVAVFKPQEPPTTSTLGLPIGGPAPPFSPDVTQTTQTARSPVMPPSFSPDETQILHAPVTSAIRAIRLRTAETSYDAPIGASLIGRGPKSVIRIDRPEVSRVHAMLNVSTTRVTIEDLNSARGTIVNGVQISGVHVLADGDVVTVGKVDLRVEIERPGGAA